MYGAKFKTMNLFKILIPKDKAQEVTEMESFSVTWWVKSGRLNAVKSSVKVFINKDEAKEFEKQLKESAKFIGAWIDTEIKRN